MLPLLFATFTTISSSSASVSAEAPSNDDKMFFGAGVSVIPHPEKAYKGGEDAYFISDDGRVLGVADGVGGWADHGVDPALYSKALMKGALEACKKDTSLNDPVKIMNSGYEFAKKVEGSSTCCIVVADGSYLNSANLGDSGFMLVRGDQIIHRTKEQQHAFNFPFQLGSSSSDKPSHANTERIHIQKGDLVILATDGVFDNLYDKDMLELTKKTHDPKQLADLIAQAASKAANGRQNTPFADGASKNGRRFTGGKLDDITVVVGNVNYGDSLDKAGRDPQSSFGKAKL